MIVVDTSAIIAVLTQEADYESVAARLNAAPQRFVPATALVETTMVLTRLHRDPRSVLNRYIAAAKLDIVPIDAPVAAAAQQAFLTFGKGRHRARLNLGDCFSYAAAKVLGYPLLFVGNDFAQTDIIAA